jgi:hypothetical protein
MLITREDSDMRIASLAALPAIFLLTSCVVVESERPGPPPRGEACLMVYDPVCAERRGQIRTYGNACEAGQARARILYPGECRPQSGPRPRPGPQPGPGPRPRPGPGPDQISCPMVYEPVCGDLNGQVRTYGNGCEAGVAGARVLYEGECRPTGGRRDRVGDLRPY